MNERQREYFLTLCSTGNITHAAEKCNVTRQGFSQSIRLLEKEFDTCLFNRKKEGVEPTLAGTLLQECLLAQDALMLRCRSDIASLSGSAIARVGIGIHTLYFDYTETRAYRDWKDSLSDRFDIDVVDDDYPQQWDALERGEIDFAITIKPPENRDVDTYLLEHVQLGLLMSTNDQLATKESIDFNCDLRDRTVVVCYPYDLEHFKTVFQARGISSCILEPDRIEIQVSIAVKHVLLLGLMSYLPNLAAPDLCVRPVINAESFNIDPFVVISPHISHAGKKVLDSYLSTMWPHFHVA